MSNAPEGTGTIIFFTVVSGLVMTGITGTLWPWFFIVPGILVGLKATESIR